MNQSVWCNKVFHPFATRLCRDISKEKLKTIPPEEKFLCLLAKLEAVDIDDAKLKLKPEDHIP